MILRHIDMNEKYGTNASLYNIPSDILYPKPNSSSNYSYLSYMCHLDVNKMVINENLYNATAMRKCFW